MSRITSIATAALLTLAYPAAAQDSGSGAGGAKPVPPPAMPQAAPPSQAAPSQPGGAKQQSSAPAVIAAEDNTHMRARALIGSSVLDASGQEVGTVKDLLIDKTGRIAGIVVSTGGFLGIGAKPVGVNAEKATVMSNQKGAQEVVRVDMTEEELTQAPTFKTKEDLRSEAEREASKSRTTGTGGAPAGGMPGGKTPR